jgi:dsDNA-binding SOS-regulon protein
MLAPNIACYIDFTRDYHRSAKKYLRFRDQLAELLSISAFETDEEREEKFYYFLG